MKLFLRSIFYMPGVIIHELSHHIFCIIFNAKVTDFCYYNFRDSSGYVTHNRPKYLFQDVLIATAPFFLNSFLGGLIAYPTIINKLSTLGLANLNWQDFLRIIMSISIGMNAIPSKGDALSIWNYVCESNSNFLFKLFSKLMISPLVFLIILINLGSSYLKIDLLYGVCVCFIGPKLIEYLIYLDSVQEFIDSLSI